MKWFIVLVAMLMSTTSFAKMLCEKRPDGKEICYRNVDVDLNGKYQERYDEDMRAAGKYSFISNTFYFSTLVALGGTYYSLNEANKYRQLQKERELTYEEKEDLQKWDTNTKNAALATGGLLIFGVVTHGMEIHFERKAHGLAIEVGTSW